MLLGTLALLWEKQKTRTSDFIARRHLSELGDYI